MLREVACVFVGSLAGLLFAFATAETAGAACNTVPFASEIYGMAPPDEELMFRGARGRINTPFILPVGERDGDEVLLLGRDVVCDSETPLSAKAAGALRPEDLLVTFFPTPGSGQGPVVLNAGRSCAKPNEVLAADLEKESVRCVDDVDVTIVPGAPPPGANAALKNRHLVRVVVPDDLGLSGGAIRVAVSTVDKGLPRDLAGQSCAEAAAEGHLDVILCIDQLFGDAPDRCGVAPKNVDPGIGSLLVMPPTQDFEKLCKRDEPGLPRCAGTSDSIQAALDEKNGTLIVPFNFKKILRKKWHGLSYRKRRLGGSLADSRFARPESGRIRIPGREFLGSLPTADETQGGHPHKPILQPVELAVRPNELNVEGRADKKKSYVFLWPRRLVTMVCDGGNHDGEACEGVVGEEKRCVCGVNGVECEDDQCRIEEKRYFECDGGPFAGTPCTRPAHCGGAGARCIATAKCRAPNEEVATGADCSDDDDCAVPQTCGNVLFDFASRANGGLLTISRVVVADARGVCDGGEKDGQSCSRPETCEGAECVRFRFDAHEEP